MKKSFNISLSGLIFNIEEDAFAKLSDYLDSIKAHYNSVDSQEILGDIESNLAEKFSNQLKGGKQVISLADVEVAIKVMGTVEEFTQEEELKTAGAQCDLVEKEEIKPPRRLYRNSDDVIIAGVCSGLAAYFGIDAVFVRLLFVVLIFLNGFGILAYLVLWLVMPIAETNTQKLEMRGKPVNLKKLEQVVKEKTAQMAQEGKIALKRNRKWVNKILLFPINVVRRLVMLFKKILKKTLPIISVLIGICLGLGMAGVILGLSLAVGVFIFNINSPYLISDIPFREIAGSIYYYVGLISVYLVALIPLIFLLFLSISLIIRRNVFRLGVSIGLIVLWMVAVVGAGVAALEIVPLAKDRISRNLAENTVSDNLSFVDVKKIRVGGLVDIKVTPGEEFNLKITGDKEALDRFKYENEGGELKITQSSRTGGFCLLCFDKVAQMEITTPLLESFIAFSRVDAEVADFGHDIRVNAGESARVKVNLTGGELSSYIAGTGGRVEVVGSPKVLKAVLEGRGRLKALDLDANEVEIDSSIFSKVELGGSARNLKLKIANFAKVLAFDLNVEEILVEAKNNSLAQVNPLFLLDAKAEDNAKILYLKEPIKIILRVKDEETDRFLDISELELKGNKEGYVEVIKN